MVVGRQVLGRSGEPPNVAKGQVPAQSGSAPSGAGGAGMPAGKAAPRGGRALTFSLGAKSAVGAFRRGLGRGKGTNGTALYFPSLMKGI